MCKAMIVLVRTDTDIDEHERLSNISLISGSYGTVVVKLNNNGGENWLK
jgi:hypothetical protein